MDDLNWSKTAIYDDLYGYIKLTDVELTVIDHSLFQRLNHIRQLGNAFRVFPGAQHTRFSHSLGVMYLMDRIITSGNIGEFDSEERQKLRLSALLHDIGDTLGSSNHADVSAAILQPFVSAENHWMIKHHAIFQGYNFFHHLGLDRNMRDRFKDDKENFDRTARFIARYDNPAFDYTAPKLSVSLFEDMVKNVFRSPKQSLYKKVADDAGV